MRKINLQNFQVASSGTARDINRRIILNIIRMRQPLSRADVARVTGLQRSTVSLIVDQLILEGWIVEGEYGRLPRGRRPIFLKMNSEKAAILGVNVRPLVTTLAVADLNGLFLAQQSMATPRQPEAFLAELLTRIRALMSEFPNRKFEGIGVSVPGRVNQQTNLLAFAPNLGWRDLDLKTPLEKETGLAVELENAANACALAENYFGEKTEEAENLIVVTVSEGIGTGIVVNGQLARGATGMAGEFGHTVIDPSGPKCSCGNRGCWEMFASNNAALRFYGEISGKRDGKMDFEDLLALAAEDDSAACKALTQTAEYLGFGIANLINGFEPEAILIVGEITRQWDRVAKSVVDSASKGVGSARMPKIRPTLDEMQPRLRGTIALVLEKHLGAPNVA